MNQRPQSLPSRSLYIAININSMEICQDKKQKLICVKFGRKKKKKIKGISCLHGATFIANPNPPCSSLLNLRIVSKTYVRTDSARLCWRKHAAFQSHPVCYFKGKFWEFNMTKGVAPDTEESFLNESDEGTPFMGVQYCKRLHRFVSYFWTAVPVWQVVPGTLFMGYFLLRSIEFTFWETCLGGKCLFFLKEI